MSEEKRSRVTRVSLSPDPEPPSTVKNMTPKTRSVTTAFCPYQPTEESSRQYAVSVGLENSLS